MSQVSRITGVAGPRYVSRSSQVRQPSSGCRSANVASLATPTTISRPMPSELAQAIDQYKLRHRRRFITFEEMLAVVKSLGYSR